MITATMGIVTLRTLTQHVSMPWKVTGSSHHTCFF